jgi:hypothetical protein
VINLYGKAGRTTKPIGVIQFEEDPARLPATDHLSAQGSVVLYYSLDQYPHILDLLRNESPLHLRFNKDNKFGQISTSKEPVGEGED